jgi:hypothetical protein
MKTTASQTTFSATWAVEMLIEPGSVPDRAVPRSSGGSVYRPGRLRLTFTSGASHPNAHALRMENGSGFMTGARIAVKPKGVVVYGAQINKNGLPGERVVTEDFYGSVSLAPDWAQDAVAKTLADLGSGYQLKNSR